MGEGEEMNSINSVCERCQRPKQYPKKRGGRVIFKAVPVSMVLNGESLCPEHFVEKAHELGLTLDEAIVGSVHD